MNGAEDLAAGLYRAPGNAGPRSRALFEYQDACVALRCIPNLLPGSPAEAVVVEWSADYVMLGRGGHRELVSVKHRDPGQHDWTFGRLRAENVFRDLHAVWRAMGEAGDYVFESNAGFEPALRPYVGNPGEHVEPDEDAVRRLGKLLEADAEEVRRFLRCFFLRRETLPDRFHIAAVATQDLAAVMERLDLDTTRARTCLTALTDRIAAASTQRPPEPSERVTRLIGFIRDIEDQDKLTAAGSLLTMEELRHVVVAASTSQEARQVPAPLMVDDPLFVGRERELAQIGELLRPGTDELIRPVALTGMTGIGKTALAARFAALHATALRTYVLPADTRTALAEAVHMLNPPPEPAADADASAMPPASRLYSALPDDPGLLAIVDGLTDPAVIDGLIARQSRTRVLITATCRHVDDAFTHIEVQGLTPADGNAYLREVMPDADLAELEDMFREFAGHPLGLVQGANYCRSQGLSPADYLERLRRHPGRTLNLGRSPGHPLPLGAAIGAAIAASIAHDPAAASLAGVIAWLAPEPVPEWLFDHLPTILQRDDDEYSARATFTAEEESVFSQAVALASPPVLDGGVEALHRYGLITRLREGLRMHPLIQMAVRESTPQAERPPWIESALGFLLKPMNNGSPADQEALVPHVAACTEAAEEADVEPLALCSALAWLGHRHYYLGTLTNARHYQEKARALAVGAGLPYEVILSCLADLIATYRTEGNIDAALAATDDWMRRAEDAGDEQALSRARRSRAQTLVYAHRLHEAAEAYAKLGADGSHVPDLSELVMDLSALAEIESGRAQYEEALRLIGEALETASLVESEARRNDHYAALHGQAAMIFHDLGRHQDALARQRQAVHAARAFGGAGMLLAAPLYALASRLLDLQMMDEAEQVIAEGMEVASARGTDSPEYGKFIQASGRVALLRRDWPQAERLLSEAVQLAEKGGEPYRAEVASACYNLGQAHTAQSNFAAAVTAFQRARDIDAAHYGDEHPELLMDDHGLAASLYADGQLEPARTAINRCLAILRKGHQVSRQLRAEIITLAIMIDAAMGRTRP